ncbi:MAG: M60 family metallopeptidase [Bacteroidales bacterium]
MKTTIISLLIILTCFQYELTAGNKSYSTRSITHDLIYFKDWSCGALNDNFRKKDLAKMQSPLMKQLAAGLLTNTYRKNYKHHSYKPVLSDKGLENLLKLKDGYSLYENMTGIYLEAGENVVLTGDLHGRNISLLIPDWERQPTPGFLPTKDPEGWSLKKQEITLREGVNVIYVEKAGNVYLNYFADCVEDAPSVSIHFLTGTVNGYFDSSVHSNEDWKRLLDNATGPVLDVKTRYMQLAYPVKFLKQFAYNSGLELAENYDKIMYEQYRFSGAVKYNRIPDKRILARVNYNYYMFRDKDGVAFLGDEKTMDMAINKDVVTNWGVHHEIGHVMQMRPQLTWGGMTEVSNNLFSMFASMQLGAPSRLSNRDIYTKAFGQIPDSGNSKFVMTIKDPFHKLVPFWQLHVYFTQKGYPDFYADMMEHLRNNPHKGTGNESIKNMHEFMKLCCDLTKTDLTDFFRTWGFFENGVYDIGDYSNYKFNISQQDMDDLKQYISDKNYPKPAIDLSRITD